MQKGKRIDKIKLQRYKQSRLQGNSKQQAIIDAGQSPITARAQPKTHQLAKIGDKEILEELDREGLVNKAFKTLEENLKAIKSSDKISAASNILKYTEGEIHKTKDITEKQRDNLYKRFNINEINTQ